MVHVRAILVNDLDPRAIVAEMVRLVKTIGPTPVRHPMYLGSVVRGVFVYRTWSLLLLLVFEVVGLPFVTPRMNTR
jgi:hypothetical protein